MPHRINMLFGRIKAMVKKKHFIWGICLLVLISSNLSGEMFWDGEAGDGLWSTGLNWTGTEGTPSDIVPTSTDSVKALVVPGYGPTIASPGAAVHYIDVGTWGWDGELTILSDGELTVSTNMFIAYGTGEAGIVKNNGSMSIGWDLYVGKDGAGQIDMYDGSVDIAGYLRVGTGLGTGRINLTGGIIRAGDFDVDNSKADIDITRGILLLKGDHSSAISDMITAGALTAYGDPAKVLYDYDLTNPTWTTVRSIAVSPCLTGDLDINCFVDFVDLQLFAQQWLDPSGCDGQGCADFDSANGVEFGDFSVLANNWQYGTEPLARIAAQSDQPDPIFYDTSSSQPFTPLGANYIPLDWIDGNAYHITFNTGFYDSNKAETALAQMQYEGYNIVRVFIDRSDPCHQALGQFGIAGPVSTNTPELYQPCLDNIIDFLQRARSHNIYVILTCDMWPHNIYYETLVGNDIPVNVENVNLIVLAQAGFANSSICKDTRRNHCIRINGFYISGY